MALLTQGPSGRQWLLQGRRTNSSYMYHSFSYVECISWDSLMDCWGAQSQKEGQEDQGTLKHLGGVHP